jgi:cell division protein FtsL
VSTVADWFAPATVAEPTRAPGRRRAPERQPARARTRPRRRAGQLRLRGHIVWMSAFALLLAGVVAVNVAVLRAHVAVTTLESRQAQLQAQNEALSSRLSAQSSAPRIEAAAHRLGLVQAQGPGTTYLDLGRP